MTEQKSASKNHFTKKLYGNVVHGKCKRCIYYSKTVECCDFYLTTKRHHNKIDEAHGGCNEFCSSQVRAGSKK
jgi:hypothetical protein